MLGTVSRARRGSGRRFGCRSGRQINDDPRDSFDTAFRVAQPSMRHDAGPHSLGAYPGMWRPLVAAPKGELQHSLRSVPHDRTVWPVPEGGRSGDGAAGWLVDREVVPVGPLVPVLGHDAHDSLARLVF